MGTSTPWSHVFNVGRGQPPTLGCVKVEGLMLQVHDVSGIVERLLEFLEIGKSHVTAETIIQMKDLLRTFPDIAEVCLASISSANVQVITLSQLDWNTSQACIGSNSQICINPKASGSISQDLF